MDLKRKYSQQKAAAKRRGIEFVLSFDEWLSIWGDKINDRGVKTGQMVMARTYDSGPYAAGNVRIATTTENHHDRALVYRVSRAQSIVSPLDYRKSLPKEECFLSSRHNVFKEYVEEDE